MKCLMLEFEAVKQGEFRSIHPFWRDDRSGMDVVVKRDSSTKTWGVYLEGSVCEDDIPTAEAAMWSASAHVLHEVGRVAMNEMDRYTTEQAIAAEHLLDKWQAGFDGLEQKAGA